MANPSKHAIDESRRLGRAFGMSLAHNGLAAALADGEDMALVKRAVTAWHGRLALRLAATARELQSLGASHAEIETWVSVTVESYLAEVGRVNLQANLAIAPAAGSA